MRRADWREEGGEAGESRVLGKSEKWGRLGSGGLYGSVQEVQISLHSKASPD